MSRDTAVAKHAEWLRAKRSGSLRFGRLRVGGRHKTRDKDAPASDDFEELEEQEEEIQPTEVGETLESQVAPRSTKEGQ